MAIPLSRQLDAGNRKPIINAAAAAAAGEVVEYAQWQAALEGNSWKDNVRVATQVNTTLSGPGAAIDGITLTNGDRVLVRAQTAQSENGIYLFNGSAAAMTRSTDASTFDELESAVVMADEGTSAGVRYRQTQVNGVIGTNNVVWSADGAAAAASETVSGIAEIATQAETDTGTDDQRIVTPLKLATSPWARKSFTQLIGDGTATSIAVTHNLGIESVQAYLYEVGGSKRQVLCEIQHTSTTVTTFLFDVAPAASSLRVRIIA